MNVLEKLAKAFQTNHGLELQPPQVKEVVTIMQGMQVQIGNDQGRMDALTRILAVALNHVGGSLDIEPDLFGDAENYSVDVNWDTEEEGGVIHVTLTMAEVAMPEVQEEDGATSGGGSNLMPVSDAPSGREEDRREPDPDEGA